MMELYRAGPLKNENYVWLSGLNVAREYAEPRPPNKNRNKIYKYTAPRKLKLINLSNVNIVRHILNQANGGGFSRALQQRIKISPNGRSVIRSSYPMGDRILANVVKQMKNKYKYNYNGWHWPAGKGILHEEFLILNPNTRNFSSLNGRRGINKKISYSSVNRIRQNNGKPPLNKLLPFHKQRAQIEAREAAERQRIRREAAERNAAAAAAARKRKAINTAKVKMKYNNNNNASSNKNKTPSPPKNRSKRPKSIRKRTVNTNTN